MRACVICRETAAKAAIVHTSAAFQKYTRAAFTRSIVINNTITREYIYPATCRGPLVAPPKLLRQSAIIDRARVCVACGLC